MEYVCVDVYIGTVCRHTHTHTNWQTKSHCQANIEPNETIRSNKNLYHFTQVSFCWVRCLLVYKVLQCINIPYAADEGWHSTTYTYIGRVHRFFLIFRIQFHYTLPFIWIIYFLRYFVRPFTLIPFVIHSKLLQFIFSASHLFIKCIYTHLYLLVDDGWIVECKALAHALWPIDVIIFVVHTELF